jgi:hypothetical protein
MKNLYSSVFIVVLMVVLFGSCVSLQDREIGVQERANVQVVEQATVSFTSWQIFHIPNSKKIKNKAYLALKKVAQEKHGSNVDVVNIVITGSWSWWELLNIYFNVGGITGGILIGSQISEIDGIIGGGIGGVVLSVFAGNTQKITATGDIILYN